MATLTIPPPHHLREHAARAVRAVIAEAMVCVRAVVVSRDDGAGEIVTPGEDALVHEAGSAPALAERMCQLSRRRFTREQLADELMPMYRLLSAQAAA